MPYEEFRGWVKYFKQRPPGWAEDRRTYMLLQAFGAKGGPEKFFPSLEQMAKAQKKVAHGDPLGFVKMGAINTPDWNPEFE